MLVLTVLLRMWLLRPLEVPLFFVQLVVPAALLPLFVIVVSMDSLYRVLLVFNAMNHA